MKRDARVIVIDTSAVVAILRDEAERRTFNEIIEEANRCLLSAVSFVEASMVMEGRMGYDGLRDFDLFILKAGIEIVPMDVEQANIARAALEHSVKADIRRI